MQNNSFWCFFASITGSWTPWSVKSDANMWVAEIHFTIFQNMLQALLSMLAHNTHKNNQYHRFFLFVLYQSMINCISLLIIKLLIECSRYFITQIRCTWTNPSYIKSEVILIHHIVYITNCYIYLFDMKYLFQIDFIKNICK